ncbi:MAG: cardiolipin synthase B [Polyangiaceae bacterium]|nr:cardiolipin synthase B [Polyangiaceae bacterium]
MDVEVAAPRPRFAWMRRFSVPQEHFVAGNRLLLLRNGPQAFPEMLSAIEGAKRQVLLEMYWFDSDHIGRRFTEALLKAAARGVEVRVIYDAIGSIDADDAMFEELTRGGVRVVEFNPILPWRERFRWARVSRRDHRKILVVDGCVGFTGGINIAAQWWPDDDSVEPWRDDMVRVEGPAVEDFVHLFESTWQMERGESLALFEPEEVGDQRRPEDQSVSVLGENYYRNRQQIANAYLANIRAAKSKIWITNSYFVPDRPVVKGLIAAAQRGVDVRVLLPGEIDVKIVRYASQAVWGKLMRAGVRIFEWSGNVLHAKTAVIDGSWCTIGTFNLDHLSVFSNLEVNLSVRDPEFGEALEQGFLWDLERSREITPHDFAFRPLGERLLELFLYRFRKLM